MWSQSIVRTLSWPETTSPGLLVLKTSSKSGLPLAWITGHATIPHTANIYSQFTVIGCVTFPTVIWQWLAQPTAVPTTLTDTEEYSLRSIAVLGCNTHSQITVGNVTLPKAVLSTVKIFAVYISKLKWAWQAYFLTHTHQTLQIYITFEDVQMILLWLFDISNSFSFTKNL